LKELEIDYPFKHTSFHIPKADNNVIRTHSLKDISYKISNGSSIIFVTGEVGIGKSVFLTQLAENYGNNALALFLDPLSNFLKNETIVSSDIVEQISWMVSGEESKIHTDQFTQSLTALARYSKNQTEKIIFILDGLDDIEDEESVESILEIIPFYLANVTFVISTNKQNIHDRFRSRKDSMQYFHIPLMTESESKELLDDINDCDLQLILNSYAPVPERLSDIRRILKKGFSVTELLERYGDHNESILETEYRLNSSYIEEHVILFSLIAFSPVSLTVLEISNSLGLDETSLNKQIQLASFLKNESGTISFANIAFKNFLEVKLSRHKHQTSHSYNKILESRTKSADNIVTLVKYKYSEEDYEGVIKELSNDSLVKVYKEQNSLNMLSKILNYGLKSSQETKFINEKIRFSHLSSLIRGVSEIRTLKSELECYLSMDDFSSAIELANKTKIIEDKIQLLALVATEQKKHGTINEQTLLDQIQYLYEKLDLPQLQLETAMDISVSIFPIFPELSFRIISTVDKVGKSGGNKSDYAYTRFYFEAALKHHDNLDSIDIDGLDLDEKFVDSVKRIQQFKGNASLESFFKEIQLLEINASERIELITEAIKAFPAYEGVQPLLQQCLTLINETPEFSANCTIYNDLSACLNKNIDNDLTNENYKKIVSQLKRLEEVGPTVDYISLNLNIAKYELLSNTSVNNRNKEIYEYVKSNVSDLLVVTDLSIINSY